MKSKSALAMFLFCCGTAHTASAGTCSINPADQQQVIRGFGTSYGSNWQAAMTDTDAKRLFGSSTDGEIGLNILRLRIEADDNAYGEAAQGYPDWQRERNNALKAQKLGALIIATSWTPPAFMKNNNSILSINHNGWPKNWPYTDVANYLGAYATYMKQQGVNLYAISVQNEPDLLFGTTNGAYDAAYWTNWNLKDLVSYSGNKQRIKGTSGAKIMVGESCRNDTNLVDSIFRSYPSQAAANIDIVGTHLYFGQHVNPARHTAALAAGKEVWQTEFYLQYDGFPYVNMMDYAVQNMEAVIKAFSQAQMSAWIQWYAKGPDRILDSSGNLTKLGYGFAQFSKFVENGYRRIGTTMTPTPGVSAISFKSNTSNRFVIVAVNRNNYPISLQPFQFTTTPPANTAKVWTTTQNVNFKSVPAVTLSANGFKRSLDARSITTFVFN